jgi:hypothetical protein
VGRSSINGGVDQKIPGKIIEVNGGFSSKFNRVIHLEI